MKCVEVSSLNSQISQKELQSLYDTEVQTGETFYAIYPQLESLIKYVKSKNYKQTNEEATTVKKKNNIT